MAASALEVDKSYYNSNTSLKYILSKKFLVFIFHRYMKIKTGKLSISAKKFGKNFGNFKKAKK